MSTETFIAAFLKDGVETTFMAENNSVTYKLDMQGATNYSVAPYIKRNGTDITQQYTDGINVREISGPTDNGDVKSFIMTSTTSSINTGFINFIKNSTASLVLIFSGKNLKSSADVDTAFSGWNSVVWPTSGVVNRFSCGYVAIYSPSLKRILYEVVEMSDGTTTDGAKFSLVYDDLSDIGASGTSRKSVYDETEYISTDSSFTKRYPTDSTSNLMSVYGLTTGKSVMINCDLFQAQELLDANGRINVSFRWLKGETVLDTFNMYSEKVGWNNVSAFTTAPATADSFSVIVSRYPYGISNTSTIGVRNMVVTQTSKDGNQVKTSGAVIGVNGIRSGTFKEFDKTDSTVMTLDLSKSLANNIVPVASIKEV